MKGNDQISPDELWKVANRLQLSGRGSDSITVSDAAEAWGVPEEQVRAALTELRTESDSSTRFAALELENQNLRFLLERAREETRIIQQLDWFGSVYCDGGHFCDPLFEF